MFTISYHSQVGKLALAICLTRAALSQELPSNPANAVDTKTETPVPAATKELKLPGVTINRDKKEIRIDAEVCLEAGLLEYAVCKPGTYEHEALLTTTAKPEVIHAALLLCGMKESPQIQATPELWWREAIKNKGARLQIHIEWDDKGQKKRASLESLMQSRQGEDVSAEAQKKEVMSAADAWIFCGSFIHAPEEGGEKTYAANISGVVVGIWPDPSALIQYGMPSGNPYEGADAGLEINEKNIPKLGTKVQMILTCTPGNKADVLAPQPNAESR